MKAKDYYQLAQTAYYQLKINHSDLFLSALAISLGRFGHSLMNYYGLEIGYNIVSCLPAWQLYSCQASCSSTQAWLVINKPRARQERQLYTSLIQALLSDPIIVTSLTKQQYLDLAKLALATKQQEVL